MSEDKVTPEAWAELIEVVTAHADKLQALAERLGPVEEVIADFMANGVSVSSPGQGDAVECDGETPTYTAWVDQATSDDLHALADWVDWLNKTYEFAPTVELLSCWPAHPGLVEELHGLRASWQHAQTQYQEDPATDALSVWHDRALAPMMHRLGSLYRPGKICIEGHETAQPVVPTNRDLIPRADGLDSPVEVTPSEPSVSLQQG